MISTDSPNFKLRPWQLADLDSLVKHANNPLVAGNLTNRFPHPYTQEAGVKFIEMAMSHQPARILTIDINGEACGGIGLHQQEDIFFTNAELGYWLAEPFWGKGIMTSAVKQMVEYGFSNFEFRRIFARPFGTNLASQKVLLNAGFELEATFEKTIVKNDQFLDEYIYAVRKK